MTDLTPLQRLDDAVHQFAKDIEVEGTVGAWVIAYETSRLQTEDEASLPLVHGTNYALGPSTSPATAMGLGRAVAQVAEAHVVGGMLGDDDEDD